MQNLILTTHTTEELTGIISQAVKEAVKLIQPSSTTASETLLSRRETADKLKISLVSCHSYYDVYFSYIYQKNYGKVQGYINTSRKSRLDVHY
jgi:hypothetical protein